MKAIPSSQSTSFLLTTLTGTKPTLSNTYAVTEERTGQRMFERQFTILKCSLKDSTGRPTLMTQNQPETPNLPEKLPSPTLYHAYDSRTNLIYAFKRLRNEVLLRGPSGAFSKITQADFDKHYEGITLSEEPLMASKATPAKISRWRK